MDIKAQAAWTYALDTHHMSVYDDNYVVYDEDFNIIIRTTHWGKADDARNTAIMDKALTILGKERNEIEKAISEMRERRNCGNTLEIFEKYAMS